MAYEPKGRTKDLIDAMRAVAVERPIWTKVQCAEVMEIVSSQVPAYLLRAVDHGVVHQRITHGKQEYSLVPFPPAATPAPQPPRENFVPAPMRAPRPGSDVHHVNPPARPAPAGTGPAAPDGLAVSSLPPTPMAAPGPAPATVFEAERAPTPAPAPLEPAPAAADASIPEEVVPGIDGDEDAEQPDAWLSCRTGAIVLTGVTSDEDGSITLEPDLVAQIKRVLTWMPLR